MCGRGPSYGSSEFKNDLPYGTLFSHKNCTYLSRVISLFQI